MKRLSLAVIALFCLLFVAPLSPASAKDAWTSVRTRNFFLVGNASEKEIRRVATRLEQFRDVLGRLLKKASLTSSTPTTVIVFKSESAYKQFAPKGSAGYFMPGQDMNYIALSQAQNTNDAFNQNPFNIIFHEFVHLLIKNNMQNVPVWFNEGLAEYYSTLEVLDGERKVKIGNPIANHVLYLREQKLLPLRTLFEVDHRSPLYNEGKKNGVFYAESWALLHYLLLGNNARRQPQFNVFINLLTNNKSVEEAFQQAFQTDFATLEKELREYIQHDTYPAQVATFEKKLEFDAEMQAAPLSEAEAQSYLGDLLLHMGNLDSAEKYLREAVRLDPQLAIAESSLGMLYLRKDNITEARRHLERAVSLNSQNYLVHYYYAYVLSREGIGTDNYVTGYPAETMQTMRAELKKATELSPNYAEAYHLLAFVNLVSGDHLEDAVGAISRAIALSPGEQDYKFMLAQIYLRKQDYPLARRVLEAIMHGSAEPETRERAQSMLGIIEANEHELARFKAGSAAAAAARNREASGTTPAANNPEVDSAGGQSGAELNTLVNGMQLGQPGPGEERVRGLLLRIDCANTNIVLTVKVGDKLLKLQRARLEDIKFITYSPDTGGEITCGARKTESPVFVTYRPMKNARSKVDGEVLVVAFVSKEMWENK